MELNVISLVKVWAYIIFTPRKCLYKKNPDIYLPKQEKLTSLIKKICALMYFDFFISYPFRTINLTYTIFKCLFMGIRPDFGGRSQTILVFDWSIFCLNDWQGIMLFYNSNEFSKQCFKPFKPFKADTKNKLQKILNLSLLNVSNFR